MLSPKGNHDQYWIVPRETMKKSQPPNSETDFFSIKNLEYYLPRSSSMAAWAAATRATGTRNGEQLT